MFDPSKLNLDLDEQDKNNNQENNSSYNTNNENIEVRWDENISNKEENKNVKNDPLAVLSNSVNDFSEDKKLEEKKEPIKEKFENSLSEENNKIVQKENKEWYNSEVYNSEKNKTEDYNNQKIEKEIQTKITNQEEKTEKKILFDININSIVDLLKYLVKNGYDFFTLEPDEEKVEVKFYKAKVEKEKKYIKFPVYTKILLKAKEITKLDIPTIDKEQEWTWEIRYDSIAYKVITKTVPSNFWEKLFFKAVETKAKVVKEVKKTPMSKIFWLLGAIIFVTLVLWGSFITFIVLNAKTIEDVKFFQSIWINLNDINTFIGTSVTVIFSILVFIEIIFFVIFLFKFITTKKSFKKQRVFRAIISFIIFIILFVSMTTWMLIDRKIKGLPNWYQLSLWNVQIYDNNELISETISKKASLISDTSNIIWPVDIKFDLTNFKNSQEKKGFNVKKFIWTFNWDEIETLEPEIIKTFDKKWKNEVKLVVEETDLHWKDLEKEIKNIPNIEISGLVKVDSRVLKNWWKIVKFDATTLKNRGKIDWYFINKDDNLSDLKPVATWYTFNPWKIIYDETIIWIIINKNWEKKEKFDKLFVIFWEEQSHINWKIKFEKDPINDLLYKIKIKDINTDFWDWFIEKFKWTIDDKKIIEKQADLSDLEKSWEIEYEFKKFWKHNISVELQDSSWNLKVINSILDIPKKLNLSNSLLFYNKTEDYLDDITKKVNYEEKTHTYNLDLMVPTNLQIKASKLKSKNLLYYLDDVEWDIDWDWKIDTKWKILDFNIPTEGNYTIKAIYIFKNRKIKDEVIKLKEDIFISAEKKEAILNIKIKKYNDYAPVKVSFDASESIIKWKNIVKFYWDFGDWFSQEWDWIIKWHNYLKAWDYNVKLKVVTSDWKEYETVKKLILKPEPQDVIITTSLKRAPVYQPIDFSSDESTGEIQNYFWDFGDWKTSNEANPSHTYKKVWKYTVTLKVDFTNQNTQEDKIEIKIVDE